MKKRKPTRAQEGRAQREMLAAIGVYFRLGYTREQVLAMATSMYDFQGWWEELATEDVA